MQTKFHSPLRAFIDYMNACRLVTMLERMMHAHSVMSDDARDRLLVRYINAYELRAVHSHRANDAIEHNDETARGMVG